MLEKGCSKVNSTKILPLKRTFFERLKKDTEQTWLELIVQNLGCVEKKDKGKPWEWIIFPIHRAKCKWQKQPMLKAAEFSQNLFKNTFLGVFPLTQMMSICTKKKVFSGRLHLGQCNVVSRFCKADKYSAFELEFNQVTLTLDLFWKVIYKILLKIQTMAKSLQS